MTTNSPDNTLKSQYHTQVTADLESNTKEQERIVAEVAALKKQLDALEEDHALLTSMQQALGTAETRAGTSTRRTSGRTDSAAPATRPVPHARSPKNATRTAATTKAPQKTAGRAAEKAAAKGRTKQVSRNGAPTLRDLVSDQLAQQQEPRSAAEVTTALAQAHPQRGAGATVVRNTLEALVAKGQALRSKQQNSVFYSATGTTKQDVSDNTDHTPVTA